MLKGKLQASFMRTVAIGGFILTVSMMSDAGEGPSRLPDAVRQRIEQLPEAERSKLIEQYRKRAQAAQARQPRAVLPNDLDSIPVRPVAGWTMLQRQPLAPSAPPLSSEQINTLYRDEMKTLPPKINDELFVRRVFLDLIGHLPAPADIDDFARDTRPNKREKLVDRLLGLPQYGEHWGKYWSDVFKYHATNQNLPRIANYKQEEWLADQWNANKPWSQIAHQILTATGLDDEAPEGFFIAFHDGDPAELAGEAARVFLGTQIACAQCHDHPYDPWKRDQFHEMAAFFGRTSFRIRKDLSVTKGRDFVLEVGPSLKPQQQYRKPDLKDPSKPGEVIQPVFLTGQPIPLQTADDQRREALAVFLTSPQNPLFARAYVNRIWCELVGFGFVEPIDDLSQQRKPRLPKLFEALSTSFARSGYDMKALMKTIILSDAYDRQIEPEPSEGSIGRFATRLSAPEIFSNLEWVLGPMDAGSPDVRRRAAGPKRKFDQVFGFDPSKPALDVEGSIPQALMLLNNPNIEQRLSVEASNGLLAKLIKTQHDDRGIIQMLYLRVLGRHPSRAELATCEASLRNTSRNEGLEDILWSLLNSTEFLHQH
jgi:hypothetical protein